MKTYLLLLSFFLSFVNSQITKENLFWCTITQKEQAKCLALKAAIDQDTVLKNMYTFGCVYGAGSFECMKFVTENYAQIMSYEVGLGYWGSELYTLRPLVAENYGTDNSKANRVLEYYANVVVRKGSPVSLSTEGMKGKSLCTAGVGTAAGWVMPMSRLLNEFKIVPVTQCNSRVSSAVNFFGPMCAPGALEKAFNNFGDNPLKACTLCQGKNDARHHCRFSDPYAGSAGALDCMMKQNADMAFVMSGELSALAQNNSAIDINQFELLCPVPKGAGVERRPISEGKECSWGTIPARLVVVAADKSEIWREKTRRYLKRLVSLFGPSGANKNTFELFDSSAYGARNLMLNDAALSFYEGSQGVERMRLETYYNWAGNSFMQNIDDLRYCPIPDVRWCVITREEMDKCSKMKLAFSVKGLKPDLNCILGKSTLGCIRMISEGFCDLMTLDAADLYIGGKSFDLVPIATEYYGDSDGYYAVGIVRKPDSKIIISNLKNKKMCHSGIGTGTGWVIPVNLVLDTNQIRVYNCHLMYAYSELVSRACVPGVMNAEYNPLQYNPVNLCETCSAGGNDKCQRDSRELYFGDAGAFRCLVERGGDVAFARHTTVNENTGGRNPSHWARNRRSDDYELLCRDGSRKQVNQWRTCNLGRVPGRTVVTASRRTMKERENMWQLLQYAQDYYASDTNAEFQMFDSGYDNVDLMFSDSAQSLRWIPQAKQNYKAWLGADFLKKLATLEDVSCGQGSGLATMAAAPQMRNSQSLFSTLLITVVAFVAARILALF